MAEADHRPAVPDRAEGRGGDEGQGCAVVETYSVHALCYHSDHRVLQNGPGRGFGDVGEAMSIGFYALCALEGSAVPLGGDLC